MLEPKTLKQTPVPDPARIPATAFKEVINLAKIRMKERSHNKIINIEYRLDKMITELYGLNQTEIDALNIFDGL